jgi:hypothetical protein
MVINTLGNVGIGTTSPTGRLTIAPYATVNSSSIEFTGADNAVISSYYSQTFAVDNTNTQSGRQFVFAKGGKGYGTQTKTMMVIDADSGNVGIGTTSPISELHVQGTSTEQILISYDSTRRMLMGRTTGYGWISPYTNGVSYDNLVLVRDGGNVGIGTTSPSAKLHIKNTVAESTGIIIENTNNAQNLNIDFWNNVGAVQGRINYAEGAGDFNFYPNTGAGEVLTLKYGGNVGIGTTSPTELVEAYKSFNGDVVYQISNPNAGTSATAQFFASNGTTRTQFFHTGTSYNGTGILASSAGLGGIYNNTAQGIALLASSAAGVIKFGTTTSNTERMRIASDGNVGT